MLCSWSSGDSIVVGSAKAASSALSSVKLPFVPPTVLQQDYGYDDVNVRKLLNESHGIFLQFNDTLKNSGSTLSNFSLLRSASIDFRVAIRACCQGLERDLQNRSDDDEQSNSQLEKQRHRTATLLQLFRHVEIIWSLCDVLFFRPEDSFIAFDLLEWSRWNFTEADDGVKEMLAWQGDSGRNLDEHPKFWNIIFMFLLTGRIDEARKLFNAHSRVGRDASFTSMAEILIKCPLTHASKIKDHTDFTSWRNELEHRRDSGIFMAVSELETMAQVLLGANQAFKKLSSLCPAWYQLIVGKTLYTSPFSAIFDMQAMAEECMDLTARSLSSPLPALDKTLLSLFRLDILSTIKDLCSSFRNWWCAAHLGMLLWHGGSPELHAVKHPHNVDLREYLLFEYGESLMSNGNFFWRIAVDYFAACPTFGMNAIRLSLERISTDSKDHHKVFKILDVCRKYDLHETAKSICKEKSIEAMKRGRYADALSWCFQAKDPQFATYIADQILNANVHNVSALREMRLLDNMTEAALLSPSITFLYKYRQLSVLRDQEHFKECGIVLTDLIRSQIAPRRFWFLLFAEVMELLKKSKEEVVFSVDQTHSLMDVLETACLEIDHVKSGNYFSDHRQDDSSFKHDLKILRTALVKTLSNAVLQIRDIE